VEANASGTPVIAYGAGGVLNPVPGQTGVFSNGRLWDALNLHSLMRGNRMGLWKIRNHALSQFSEEAFFAELSR